MVMIIRTFAPKYYAILTLSCWRCNILRFWTNKLNQQCVWLPESNIHILQHKYKETKGFQGKFKTIIQVQYFHSVNRSKYHL